MSSWDVEAREAVRDTIAGHAHAGDRARSQEVAECYSEDGSLQIGSESPIVGRSAIAAALRGVPFSGPAPGYVRHHVSSVRFTLVTRESIEASSYFLVITDIGPDHWGRYRDSFVPVGNRWLLRSRQVRTDGFSPASLFRPAQ